MLFLLYLPHSSSFVSVVFDFNPSLNIVVSVSPISSSVYLMGMEKSGLFMDAFCVFVILQRESSTSVVFDFNASLNDAAPVSPIFSTIIKTAGKKS